MSTLTGDISNFIFNSHFAAWFLDALLKSFVVLALAGGVCGLWRQASAATRHLVWFLAVATLPCLPLLTSLLPSWQKPLWSVSTGFDSGSQVSLSLVLAPGSFGQKTAASPEINKTATAAATDSRKVAAHFSTNWMIFGLLAWFAGVAVVFTWLAAGQFRLYRFSRSAQPLQSADWARLLKEARKTLRLQRSVTLLQSADNVMPMTWGWWRPVVLLPTEAAQWPEARRRIVLLHELAHVKRWDCLTQLAVKMVCAVYWFNPLVWFAARQMGVERERACDDLVLNAGCRASDYAGHLVDIAGSFQRMPQMAAIAMARPSGLESRVVAILDGRRNRSRIAKMAAALIAFAFLGLGLFVGSYAAENSAQGWSLDKSMVSAQLKSFIADKERQEGELIPADITNYLKNYGDAARNTNLPDFGPFFAAASRGDWLATSNLLSAMEARGGGSEPTNHYPRGMWLNPAIEAEGALAAFAVGNEKYSKAFGDEVIQSIPAGSIYLGGTDPGRFIITGLQKSQIHGDPFYTLTQNALADGSYLRYLRSMYGSEIYIPTDEDSQASFMEYVRQKQLHSTNGRIQISGLADVMNINGLLVKVIFDKNPSREFFIEESYPLDWMYPNLEPHGFIMKINRQPLAELSAATVQRDHDFWQSRVTGMIGGWLQDDTPLSQVVAFAEKVYLQHDLTGFSGDPEFVQNDYTSKMFSKLRLAIAGLYAWRAENDADTAEKVRMAQAADFAFRQALALCPSLPELAERYSDFLMGQNREADAAMVTDLANQFKPLSSKSIFQMRPVLDAPADDSEVMTNMLQITSAGRLSSEVLNVATNVLLDQTALKSAKVGKDYRGSPQIELTLTDDGQKQFATITSVHLHQHLAIIIDGRLWLAPVIAAEIDTETVQISGSFSEPEAQALAQKINDAIAR